MNPPPGAPDRRLFPIFVGYVLWPLGFLGLHRFYYGKHWSGLLWLCTFGLLGFGWMIDLLLIPRMSRQASERFTEGHLSYLMGYFLTATTGIVGLHRFYMGKWATGVLWLVSGGLLGFGVLYDLATLNLQIDALHRAGPTPRTPWFDAPAPSLS